LIISKFCISFFADFGPKVTVWTFFATVLSGLATFFYCDFHLFLSPKQAELLLNGHKTS